MFNFTRRSIGTTAASAMLLGATLLAQSHTSYLNVESPQVSPLAIMQAHGRTLLLACNTPDNSVEIWNTDETIQPVSARFVQRVPVGLEPVSVLVVGDRFWTANFLGDSVSAGVVEPAAGGGLRARLTGSRNLPAAPGHQRGDEPMDLAYFDLRPAGPEVVVVSMFTGSAVAMLNANTLASVAGPFEALQFLPPGIDATPHGLKEVRSVRARGNQVFLLATKGGVTHPQSLHDLDVLVGTVSPAGVTITAQVSRLGSTNYNMRLASNGDLYVVGAEAMNFDFDDKPTLRSQPTGFVKSTLYRRTATQTFRRDANLTSSATGTGVPIPRNGAGGQGRPASTLTDLVLIESGGVVTRVYATAMSNDRIVRFSPPTGSPVTSPDVATWSRSTIDLPTTPLNGGPRFGPRGIVARPDGTRLYVLNRLDNSIVTINTATDAVMLPQSFALAADPTPAHVKVGRRFLYDAEISGNGFVSCASCHTDGRTDALAWRLGNRHQVTQVGVPPELPPTAAFIESLFGTGSAPSAPQGSPPQSSSDPDYQLAMRSTLTFDPAPPAALGVGDTADDKREMVTQSLQGLLNFEVAPNAVDLVTNAPFHWRGDKASLSDFNEAFVTLLGGPHVGTAQTGPIGLLPADMAAFEAFVHSIVYPPNPKQPKSRTYAANTPAGRGLQFFHTSPGVLGSRSCVHCHALPEGSNNRLTVFSRDPVITGFVALENRQPIETGALRGLFQKEPLLEAGGSTTSGSEPIVGHFGLNHNGIQPATAGLNGTTPTVLTTINSFVDLFGNPALGLTPTPANELLDIKQFVHQMDWGVAPMVGEVSFIDQTVLSTPALQAVEIQRILDIQMQSNLGNAGAVAWVLRPNHPTQARRGFRWSPNIQRWVEEPTYIQMTSVDITMLFTGAPDVIMTMSVPLGSERRIASLFGTPVPPPLNLQPTNVDMIGLVTNTAYAAVPTFQDSWIPWWWGYPQWAPNNPPGTTTQPAPFFNFPILRAPDHWNGTANVAVDDVFNKALRVFQFALFDHRQSNSRDYGLPRLRHEAPRRLRLKGDLILTGATLRLEIPDPSPGFTMPPNTNWSQLPNPPVRLVELPLHPTAYTDGGKQVWETAVEFDPLMTYSLMLGGPKAPPVVAAIRDINVKEHTGQTPDPNFVEPTTTAMLNSWTTTLSPDAWNWYRISVRNPGTGSVTSTPIWKQLDLK